jgi:hypothetical protein
MHLIVCMLIFFSLWLIECYMVFLSSCFLKQWISSLLDSTIGLNLLSSLGLRRCGKSCRLRWLNYLRPNIKHGEFTEHEDRVICSMYASIGSRYPRLFLVLSLLSACALISFRFRHAQVERKLWESSWMQLASNMRTRILFFHLNILHLPKKSFNMILKFFFCMTQNDRFLGWSLSEVSGL